MSGSAAAADPAPGVGQQPPHGANGAAAATRRREDLQRTESIMMWVRLAAAVFAAVQTLIYRPPDTVVRPDHVTPVGLLLAGLLAAVAATAWLLNRRVQTLEHARVLAMSSLALDVAIAVAFVWMFTFDRESVLWIVLFVLPLEGALKFQLRGALLTWGSVTLLYATREVWGSGVYDYPVLVESISFRMGINLLVTMVAGSMAKDLLSQRARVLDSYGELERIDLLRQHLVSTLAHDVRGPLSTVRAITTMLRDRADLPEDQRRELLNAAERQAGRLQYLAEDLLDMARLEQGRLQFDMQDVAVSTAVEEALTYADGQGRVEADIDTGLAVQADPRRLEQVLVNLVDNCLRYGEPPFRLVGRRSGDMATIAVIDQGAGVPEGKRDQLFQPFAAGESKGSVGLGLWICRTVLEAQSGTLTYHHDDDGSCFTISLPLADQALDDAAQPEPAASSP